MAVFPFNGLWRRPSLINSNESVMFFTAAITEATHHRRMCFSGLLPSLLHRRLLRQLPYSNDTAVDTYDSSFFVDCRRRVILAIAPSCPYQLSCLPSLLRRRNLLSCLCKLGIPKSELKEENPQAYAIIKKFDIISISSHDLLVIKPTPDEDHSIAAHKRVSNYATIFDDIRAAHIPAHEKRVTLHNKCKLSFGDSIPLHTCIAFGDTCPVCLKFKQGE